MDILKKILVVIIACGILAALFTLSIAIFMVALVLFPIIYIYQKYRLGGKSPMPMQTDSKTIDVEFEVIDEIIEEVKK